MTRVVMTATKHFRPFAINGMVLLFLFGILSSFYAGWTWSAILRTIHLESGHTKLAAVESIPSPTPLVIGEVISPTATAQTPTASPAPQGRWPPQIEQWRAPIERYAAEANLDPDLVAAVMRQESNGDAWAKSYAGAMGLMQVMPLWDCATYVAEANIQCGVGILRYYIDRAGGDVRAGLAAYNAGERGRDQRGLGWGYADKVLAFWRDYGMN